MIVFDCSIMMIVLLSNSSGQINMNGFPACASSVFWVHH